jgi:hypothetical protein
MAEPTLQILSGQGTGLQPWSGVLLTSPGVALCVCVHVSICVHSMEALGWRLSLAVQA